MINKITGWDNVESTEISESKSLPVGNYIVRIKRVEDVPQKEYIKVEYDIIKGEFTGYFGKYFDTNGKWSNQGTKYASYKETAIDLFKQFITAVEKSNQGYVWDWNEQSLVGKQFVAVYGEEEWEDGTGNVNIGVKLRNCRSIDALNKGEIKPVGLKKLKQKKTNPIVDTSFQVNEGDLPF